MAPTEYVGPVLALCQEKRGVHKGIEYLQDARVVIAYELPLNEIVLDFYDKLRIISGQVSEAEAELDALIAAHKVDDATSPTATCLRIRHAQSLTRPS
jgi:GTP-binding protein LepA